MNLQISEEKIIDFNIAHGIVYTISIAEESPFGNNYLVIKIKDIKASNLLYKYEENDIEFYYFNEVLYVYFNKDNYCFYLLNLLDEFKVQLKEKKQIIFIIKENNIEYFMTYDKIIK